MAKVVGIGASVFDILMTADTFPPEDTKLEVPYNTYIYPGLPPGAISNPSATAILAALNPSQNGYYFFVSSDTETYFSQTYDQHMYYINLIASGMG